MTIGLLRVGAALWLLMMSSAHAQTLGGGQSFELPIARLVVGLLLCSFLAILAAVMIKRFIRGGGAFKPGKSLSSLLRLPARKLRVIESQRISAHADLCLVACDGRRYLIVTSAGAATVLREDTADETEAAT